MLIKGIKRFLKKLIRKVKQMMSQQIHNVVSFKVDEIKENKGRTTDLFYTRKITVIDQNGNDFELTMFSDDKHTLIPIEPIGYR